MFVSPCPVVLIEPRVSKNNKQKKITRPVLLISIRSLVIGGGGRGREGRGADSFLSFPTPRKELWPHGNLYRTKRRKDLEGECKVGTKERTNEQRLLGSGPTLFPPPPFLTTENKKCMSTVSFPERESTFLLPVFSAYGSFSVYFFYLLFPFFCSIR